MKILTDIKKMVSGGAMSMVKGAAIKFLLLTIAVIIGITAVFKIASYTSARYACHIQWQESGIEYKYTLRGGCLLKRGDGWIPSKNFRVQ